MEVDPVAPGNALKCSMHATPSPTCSGPVAAIVTMADAGSPRNRYRVCQQWYDTNCKPHV
ncbi:hypothetical protein GCM10010215_75610 [Streptomyces virginiae]|uniref:Uncharacterized protein n=1 Tax=Streptomyces virginiae TaxID=1961 RepID=A0ABQ3NNZ6_STRVG|nr:hypothetical protein GCM10010215_75610 [Streptomyces virginiae]GHI14489.1 hypothetical protein Scinn_39520 [Streptomyces virginiae]